MKITLTEQETHNLIKQALVENHADLLIHADFDIADLTKINIEINNYNTADFLTITKHVEPVTKESK
jgi:3-keto-L-gulonate-6-phosphate decarboxylase